MLLFCAIRFIQGGNSNKIRESDQQGHWQKRKRATDRDRKKADIESAEQPETKAVWRQISSFLCITWHARLTPFTLPFCARSRPSAIETCKWKLRRFYQLNGEWHEYRLTLNFLITTIFFAIYNSRHQKKKKKTLQNFGLDRCNFFHALNSSLFPQTCTNCFVFSPTIKRKRSQHLSKLNNASMCSYQ